MLREMCLQAKGAVRGFLRPVVCVNEGGFMELFRGLHSVGKMLMAGFGLRRHAGQVPEVWKHFARWIL